MPEVPAPGGVARDGGSRTSRGLFVRGLLGPSRAWFRRPGRPPCRGWACSGGTRRQPHREDIHRRPLRRLALGSAVAGGATQPVSVSAFDGLQAVGTWVTAVVRCAPPGNRPTPQERDNCLPYLEQELALLPVRALLALGGFAYEACCRVLGVTKRPAFGHGVEVPTDRDISIVCSYHPSQQNTFTGRLTEEMLDAAVRRAWALAGGLDARTAGAGAAVRRPRSAALHEPAELGP